MALLEDLDLDHVENADDVEKKIASGSLCPEGLHHAQLSGCREAEANSGTKFHELSFTVIAGPAKGLVVKETLYGPSGKSAEGDERAKNRMRMFAHRLGVLKKEQIPGTNKSKYVPIPGITSFADLIDKASCVIEVKHEDREYTDKKGTLKKTKEAKLTFEGVLPTDDKRVTEKKIPLGKVTATANSGKLPHKDDFGKL